MVWLFDENKRKEIGLLVEGIWQYVLVRDFDGLELNDGNSDEGYRPSGNIVRDGLKWRARKMRTKIITGNNWRKWVSFIFKSYDDIKVINLNILSFRSWHYSFSLHKSSVFFCSATATASHFCFCSMLHARWWFKKLLDLLSKHYDCSII